MKVADNVWYVTGGASGLGEATVRRLYELGGYVSIWDISFEQAEALASDLNGKGGKKRAMAAQVDVVSEEEVMEAIKKTDQIWPDVPLGGCVNCGGECEIDDSMFSEIEGIVV
jgi:NAD(P)-dependent dehydrogenase (short-subunit alcohol dehydrogenase family)